MPTREPHRYIAGKPYSEMVLDHGECTNVEFYEYIDRRGNFLRDKSGWSGARIPPTIVVYWLTSPVEHPLMLRVVVSHGQFELFDLAALEPYS